MYESGSAMLQRIVLQEKELARRQTNSKSLLLKKRVDLNFISTFFFITIQHFNQSISK
jgi:hypothetical protein